MESYVSVIESAWFWPMVQAVIVAVSALLVWRQIQLQRFTHIMSAMADIREEWDSPQMMEARWIVCESYLSDSECDASRLLDVAYFFKQLGYHVEKKSLPVQFVWEAHDYSIQCYWLILGDRLLEMREEDKNQQLYRWFVKLDKRMRAHTRFGGKRTGCFPKQMVHAFANREVARYVIKRKTQRRITKPPLKKSPDKTSGAAPQV